MSVPVVSVVVPTYNAADTLLETIESVRRQTLSAIELIVIDDGSTDDTRRLLGTVHDPRLQVFSYPNAGIAAARNRGLERARGEFVSFIDADDLWTADKLELQLEALRRRPEAAIAYSWTAFIDAQGRFLFAKEPSRAAGDVSADLVRSCFVASGSNILARKRCLEAIGGFDTTLEAAQDWDLCLRVAGRWPFAVVPRYQILYRIAETTMSANVVRSERACVHARERAFAHLSGLSDRTRNESLSNVKQHVAFLYLSRARGVDLRREAGRRLAESIRLYPRTLLTRKTWHLILTWLMVNALPARMRRTAVLALLRCYGRWLTLTRPAVRELVARSAAMQPQR